MSNPQIILRPTQGFCYAGKSRRKSTEFDTISSGVQGEFDLTLSTRIGTLFIAEKDIGSIWFDPQKQKIVKDHSIVLILKWHHEDFGVPLPDDAQFRSTVFDYRIESNPSHVTYEHLQIFLDTILKENSLLSLPTFDEERGSVRLLVPVCFGQENLTEEQLAINKLLLDDQDDEPDTFTFGRGGMLRNVVKEKNVTLPEDYQKRYHMLKALHYDSFYDVQDDLTYHS